MWQVRRAVSKEGISRGKQAASTTTPRSPFAAHWIRLSIPLSGLSNLRYDRLQQHDISADHPAHRIWISNWEAGHRLRNWGLVKGRRRAIRRTCLDRRAAQVERQEGGRSQRAKAQQGKHPQRDQKVDAQAEVLREVCGVTEHRCWMLCYT